MGSACEWQNSVVVDGLHIAITLSLPDDAVCFAAPGFAHIDVGFLPAGNYDLTVTVKDGSTYGYSFTDSLVVAPATLADVPTLDPTAIALLLTALSVAGVIAVRR